MLSTGSCLSCEPIGPISSELNRVVQVVQVVHGLLISSFFSARKTLLEMSVCPNWPAEAAGIEAHSVRTQSCPRFSVQKPLALQNWTSWTSWTL